MQEDLKNIFEGSELTEDFKDKFQKIYEARLSEEVQSITEETEAKYKQISESYAEYVVAEMEDKASAYIEAEVVPSVERYVDYVAEQFIEKNELAIESAIKVELAENMLNSMSSAVKEFNVVIPEGQEDVVAKLELQVKEANELVNSLLQTKDTLAEEITALNRATIVAESLKDCTETQKEKIEAIVEAIKFVDEDQFRAAIVELKESYAPASVKNEPVLDTKKPLKESTKDDSYLAALFEKI